MERVRLNGADMLLFVLQRNALTSLSVRVAPRKKLSIVLLRLRPWVVQRWRNVRAKFSRFTHNKSSLGK
jgi:hypothetical protein